MKKLASVGVAAVAALLLLIRSVSIEASENVYTVNISGYYRSPVDGKIEDSGGESQEALGQSMVEGVVDTTGVLQENADGSYGLYVRFNLMDNISDVSFGTVANGDSSWTATSYEVTASTNETKDFYIPIPAKESYVRAECYVEPMGRSVIFYIGYENLVSGNSTDITLYEGESSSSKGNLKTNEVNTVDSSDGSTGLTIGYSNATSSNTAEEADNSKETAIGVIDDSVWITLFGVVFTAVFLAGLLLIAVVLMVRRILKNHDEIRQKNIKKMDRYENEETFIDDFETIGMDL